MDFTRYQLPSGEIVDVDATAAKGQLFIGFTLKGGRVVTAKRVQEERNGRCLCGGWIVDHFDAKNRKLSCEQAARRTAKA